MLLEYWNLKCECERACVYVRVESSAWERAGSDESRPVSCEGGHDASDVRRWQRTRAW